MATTPQEVAHGNDAAGVFDVSNGSVMVIDLARDELLATANTLKRPRLTPTSIVQRPSASVAVRKRIQSRIDDIKEGMVCQFPQAKSVG